MSQDVYEEKHGLQTWQELQTPFLSKDEISGVVAEHITSYVSREGINQGYEPIEIEYNEVIASQPPVQTPPTIVRVVHDSNSASVPVNIPNVFCLSVFVMLCCCLPLGLSALIMSIYSQGLLSQGRGQEALDKAKMSECLNIIGIVAGVLILGITLFIIFTTKGQT